MLYLFIDSAQPAGCAAADQVDHGLRGGGHAAQHAWQLGSRFWIRLYDLDCIGLIVMNIERIAFQLKAHL